MNKPLNTSVVSAMLKVWPGDSFIENNSLERALASLPLFGGTTPSTESPPDSDTGSSQAKGTESTSQSGNDTATQAGGDSGTTTEMDPAQIADLLKQVQNLTNVNKQLLQENNANKAKQQEAERAKLSREEAMEKDLEQRDEIIAKMDRALRNQAIINAINNFKDVTWHDPMFPISKLDPAILENMTVDLEAGTVTVTGVENDLRRIAKDYEWAVVNPAAQSPNPPPRQQPRPRGTGTPPAPPNGSNDKATRRQSLIDKWPVLTQGRTPVRR